MLYADGRGIARIDENSLAVSVEISEGEIHQARALSFLIPFQLPKLDVHSGHKTFAQTQPVRPVWESTPQR